MIPKRLLLLVCALSPFYAFMIAGDFEQEADVTFGYQFLSNSADNPYYRSQDDVREGAVVDSFHFLLSSKDGKNWFDRISVDGSLADRVDADKSIRILFSKAGKFEASMKYTFQNDFFWDPYYNWGFNNRDLTRSNFQADFKWKGVRGLTLSTGYGVRRSKGPFGQVGSYWGDFFSMPINQDYEYEDYRLGASYSLEGFSASVNQSWVRVYNRYRYDWETVQGAGMGTQAVSLTYAEHGGTSKGKIPVTQIAAGYRQEKFSIGFDYSRRNGVLDNQIVDSRNFLFEDFGSQTDMIVKTMGGSDIPESDLSFRAGVTPCEFVDFEYEYTKHKVKSDAGQVVTEAMAVTDKYGHSWEYSQDRRDTYNYRNDSDSHTFTAAVTPVRHLTVKVAFDRTRTKLDGLLVQDNDVVNDFSRDYVTKSFEISGRYRTPFKNKTDLSVTYDYETYDKFVFPTTGRKKNDFRFSVSQQVGERLTCNLLFRDSKLRDAETDFSNNVKMLDVSAQYLAVKDVVVGCGFTRLNLNSKIWQMFYIAKQPVASQERDSMLSNSYYISAGIGGDRRVTGDAAIYYVEDEDLKIHRLSPQVNVQVRLAKHLFAGVTARFLDYQENYLPVHDYKVNQVLVSLRWKY